MNGIVVEALFLSFISGALRALCEPAHGDPRAGVGSPYGAELR